MVGACAMASSPGSLVLAAEEHFVLPSLRDGRLAPHPGDHHQLRLGSFRVEDKASPGSSLLPAQDWALADGKNKMGVPCKTPVGPLPSVGLWLSA